MTLSLHIPFIRGLFISRCSDYQRRLTQVLLLFFCLAFIGQAFARPMVCEMSANSMINANTSSAGSAMPCHLMLSADHDNLTTLDATRFSMDCCEPMDTHADRQVIADHDCACPDGGSALSFTIITRLTDRSLSTHEQAHYYSTSGFSSPINSALFRPPIA